MADLDFSFSVEFTIPDSRATRETWAILYGYFGPLHENGEYYSHHLQEETMARQFRKKPVVIEAMEWDGNVIANHPVTNWIEANHGEYTWTPSSPQRLAIDTLEGLIIADPGDWIIRGINGEFYPCKPDIFKKTYDPVGVSE